MVLLQYIVAGILFKFVLDRGELFGSDRLAAKEAGHQLKGIMMLQQCSLTAVKLPLMLVIDYRGFRLLATSLLPIDKSTIVYGSYDAGCTIHHDPDVAALINPALEALRLAVRVLGLQSKS